MAKDTGGSSVGFTVLGLIGWGIGRRASNRARKRDDERVGKLPFKLEGYGRALGTSPDAFLSIDVRLAFTGTPPPLDEVASKVAAFDRKATVTTDEGVIVIRRKALQTIFSRTNYQAHRWIVKLLESTLVPLHTVSPLASVGVRAVGSTVKRAQSSEESEQAEELEESEHEEEDSDDVKD